MTGLPQHNAPAFNKAATALRKRGYNVVNPPELDKQQPQRTWEDCLRRDITQLMVCKEIATLPGWKKSRGATLEVYIGKALKFPVHTVSYYLED
jgi:hypothetical protein